MSEASSAEARTSPPLDAKAAQALGLLYNSATLELLASLDEACLRQILAHDDREKEREHARQLCWMGVKALSALLVFVFCLFIALGLELIQVEAATKDRLIENIVQSAMNFGLLGGGGVLGYVTAFMGKKKE